MSEEDIVTQIVKQWKEIRRSRSVPDGQETSAYISQDDYNDYQLHFEEGANLFELLDRLVEVKAWAKL